MVLYDPKRNRPKSGLEARLPARKHYCVTENGTRVGCMYCAKTIGALMVLDDPWWCVARGGLTKSPSLFGGPGDVVSPPRATDTQGSSKTFCLIVLAQPGQPPYFMGF